MPDPAPCRGVLTPEQALAYLATLWPGMRAGAVLGADGAPLAGDGQVGARASALLAAAGRDAVWSAAGSAGAARDEAAPGVLFAARSQRHVVALETGAAALRTVAELDLRRVLEALESA